MITVYPIGTTIYDPDRCFNGYTVFCVHGEAGVRLIDMNGNIVKEWRVEHPGRARLLKNGNLLALTRRKIVEYSWDGHLVWEFEHPQGTPHHDFQRLDNGNTLVIRHGDVPDEYRKKIRDPVRRSARPFRSDVLLEVTPNKKIIWEWHAYKHFDINRFDETSPPGDWIHTNTIQALPENKWHNDGDERFKPGNILFSPRNLSSIFVVDKDAKEIVWEYSGNYAGGLAGQHESHMIEKGFPGEGNIIIFDNGAPPLRSRAHVGKSFILEIEPPTGKIVWKYENGYKFFSPFRAGAQRLPNGNTLITESHGPRIFEVTREGEIVWEYAVEWQRIPIGWAYRYSYDYCPQLSALPKPEEKRVTPPPHVRTQGQFKTPIWAPPQYRK